MNLKQIQYSFGIIKNRTDIASLLTMGYCVEKSVGLAPYTSIEQGVVMLGLSASCFIASYLIGRKTIKGQLSLWKNRRVVNRNKELFPLEFVDEIRIEDVGGLEMLIERTAEKEKYEWGTVLKVSDCDGIGIVGEILDSFEAENKRLASKRKKHQLYIDFLKSEAEGYSGFHHFHPIQKGLNYNVNSIDRSFWLGGLHLLTFNLPDGPEIIGFNSQFTYLPTDKTKRKLVRATPKDILKYLG